MMRIPVLASGAVLASALLLCPLTTRSFAQGPVVSPPTISSQPAFEGMITFTVTGTFTSAAGALGQPFTATVDVGGAISPATVSGTDNPFAYKFTGARAAGASGTFPVIVSVTDKDGNTGTGTTLLTVFSVVPVVAGVSPITVNAATPTDFTLGFTDPRGAPDTIYSWHISWGDGAHESGTASVPGPFTRRHTYAARGVYAVRVFVADKDGSASSRTSTVNVVRALRAVTAPFVSPTSTSEGAVINFTVTGTLTLRGPRNAAGQPFTATVNWGDGSTSPATVSAGATFAYNFSGGHTYAASGTYDVTVAMTDKHGAAVISAPTRVTVGNAAPSVAAPAISPTTTNERTVTTFTVTGSFTNPGGATDQPFTATVHWGDGSTSAATVSGAANPFAYRFNGSHTYALSGTYHVTVAVTDKDGVTATSAPKELRVESVAPAVTLSTWALLFLVLVLIAFGTYDEIRPRNPADPRP